ncbi:MAG: Rid family detoxifying hydrolase [Pseudomonadota bacterium]
MKALRVVYGIVGFFFVSAAMGAELEFLNKSGALAGDYPFSEAVRVGDMLYLSGQIGTSPGSSELVDGGIRAEAKQTLENIRAVLVANNLNLDDVAKCTVMLADIGEWPAFNAVYREFFEAPYPARSAFGTVGLALGARVEVECWAVFGD